MQKGCIGVLKILFERGVFPGDAFVGQCEDIFGNMSDSYIHNRSLPPTSTPSCFAVKPAVCFVVFVCFAFH